jgi:hypothetical protein
VIGRHADVGRTPVDQREDGCEHAAHGSNFPAVDIARGRKRVVMAEQFVGSVDEIDLQARSPARSISGSRAARAALDQLVVMTPYELEKVFGAPSWHR